MKSDGIVKIPEAKKGMSYSIDPITLLRGLLALAIIWGHLQVVPLEIYTTDVFFLISFPGRIIVWMFFIISGYSIYAGYRVGKYNLNLKDSFRFYYNRAIRILPLFYITTILTWLSLIYISPGELPPWQQIIRTLLFFEFNMKSGIYTFSPTWYIGILIYFYLVAPFLAQGYMFIKKKLTFREIFWFVILISVAGHWIGSLSAKSNDIRNLVGCLPLFIFGFLSYDMAHDDLDPPLKLYKLIERKTMYVILFVIFELIFFIYKRGGFFALPMELVIGSLGAVMLTLLTWKTTTHLPENIMTAYLKKVLCELGKQSYGLYLWHSLVIILLFRSGFIGISGPPFGNIKYLAMAFAITVSISYALSILSRSLIEKPYKSLYKRQERCSVGLTSQERNSISKSK